MDGSRFDVIQMILTKIESNLECICQKLHKYTDGYTQPSCQLYTQKNHRIKQTFHVYIC